MFFLANEKKPFIDACMNKYVKAKKVKDTIIGIISSIQTKGIKQTRLDYHKEFKSKKSWYNYLERIKNINKHIETKELKQLTSYQVLDLINKELKIYKKQQPKLPF